MKSTDDIRPARGLGDWLLRCWRRSTEHPARLALIERMALGPKHSLALIEADGVRLLIATSVDGTPAFFSLQNQAEPDPFGVYPARTKLSDEGAAQGPSGALPRMTTGAIQRSLRRSQTERRLGFEGRVSW